MKSIECPLCGTEMNWFTVQSVPLEIGLFAQCFYCPKCWYRAAIVAPTEKAARKAWGKSLIGQLRKEYHRWLDFFNKSGGVAATADVKEFGYSVLKAVDRMFGGDRTR